MSVNVIGNWDFHYNFDGSGNYYQTTLTVNSNGTFSDQTGGAGTWSLVGNLFGLNFKNNGYQYTGLFSGAVVCGYNGTPGNPTPPDTAFYLVKQGSNSKAAEKAEVATVP